MYTSERAGKGTEKRVFNLFEFSLMSLAVNRNVPGFIAVVTPDRGCYAHHKSNKNHSLRFNYF